MAADLCRMTARWDGIEGAPGYTTFYSLLGDPPSATADALAASFRAFFLILRLDIPTPVVITIDPTMEIIDSGTGVLNSISTAGTGPFSITFAAGGNYSSPSGGTVGWLTAGIHLGKRVKGRTYVVPLSNSSYETNGTLTGSQLTNLGEASRQRLAANPGAAIWARPRFSKTLPRTLVAPGAAFAISGHVVRDKAAILTSRRD